MYYFGPNFGFNATAGLQITSPGRNRTFNIDNTVKFLRLGAIMGVAYKFNDFLINVAYDKGFTEYLDVSEKKSNSKFNSLQLNIAYLYTLDF